MFLNYLALILCSCLFPSEHYAGLICTPFTGQLVKGVHISNNKTLLSRISRLEVKLTIILGELPYSAIQLPAAISIWESSGFLSFMVCGSRRQYFVFAPHQAFAFSLCILYLFLAMWSSGLGVTRIAK